MPCTAPRARARLVFFLGRVRHSLGPHANAAAPAGARACRCHRGHVRIWHPDSRDTTPALPRMVFLQVRLVHTPVVCSQYQCRRGSAHHGTAMALSISTCMNRILKPSSPRPPCSGYLMACASCSQDKLFPRSAKHSCFCSTSYHASTPCVTTTIWLPCVGVAVILKATKDSPTIKLSSHG